MVECPGLPGYPIPPDRLPGLQRLRGHFRRHVLLGLLYLGDLGEEEVLAAYGLDYLGLLVPWGSLAFPGSLPAAPSVCLALRLERSPHIQ